MIRKSLFLALICLFFACFHSNSFASLSGKKKIQHAKANELVLSPTLDGFLSQASGNFDQTSAFGELKKYTGFNREVYLNFDLSNITINAKTAKVRVFCDSFDKFSEPEIAIYCFQGYRTDGLTWATRPAFPTPVTIISVNSQEFTKSWLEWDISAFLPTILQSQSKQATFVLAVKTATAGVDALIKLHMSENALNKPNLLLSDEDSNTGGNGSVIKMPSLFSNNMIIQRDKPIKIWGEVSANEPVTINFDGTNYQTQCNAEGKFSTTLPAKSVSQNAYTLTISAKGETQTYTNVVMGDVFLCGGQSNMAMFVSSTKPEQVENALADSNYPDLRFFEVAKIVSGGVVLNQNDKPWKSAIPERIPSWSAVAFFLGRDLHKHLNIPIGLINVSHGGAPSDAFISPEAYAADPALNAAKRPNGTGIYQYYTTPSSLYTAMVSKVAGYPVKGVFWYQAEANAGYWQNYKTIFKGLIKDWRTKWNDPALPWIFVQLPAFETSTDWAETREIQLQVWKEDPNTGMAVTMDCGEAGNIHPQDKYTVAKRMLPQVRAKVYGENIICNSPTYKSHTTDGSDIYISFNDIGSGLKAIKAISEFEIAAADKVYKPATAELLADNRIKISNVTISNPVFFRYAFRNFTSISIYTTDELSLPLSPFRFETTTPVTEQPTDLTAISFDKIAGAYASSTFGDRTAICAVNGSGLVGDGHEAIVAAKAWHTDDRPFPHFIKIELKDPQEINAMRIWNLNWTSTYLNRGVRDIEIYVSESNIALQNVAFNDNAWEKVMNYSMQQANGLNTYKGELLTFPAVKNNIKWVGIQVMNSYNSANGYMGISEIKLYNPPTNTHDIPIQTNKNSSPSQLVVYPNPTKGVLNIEKNNDPGKIEVFDLIGNLLYQSIFSPQIDLSFLSKGVCFIRTDLNQMAKVLIQ
jgi:sialate O-acetylesterase